MFRLINRAPHVRVIKQDNSIPIIFRSTRRDDLLEVSHLFLFGEHYIDKDNIILLYPDMVDINGWWMDMPREDYSNQSFYSGTNTSNMIVSGSDPYIQIAVIAKTEGEKMKGFQTLQTTIDVGKFTINHRFFPIGTIQKETVGEYTLIRLTDIPATEFGMSFNCTQCRIPIGSFVVSRIVH